MIAEVFLEPFGDPEDAAELSDVFTGDDDLGIGFQRSSQPRVECLRHRENGHQ